MQLHTKLHKHKEGGTLSQEFGFMNIRVALMQFKSKRIGQGTIAVHVKSAPTNIVSVNDIYHKRRKIKYNIRQKAKIKGERDTLLNQHQQQPGIQGGKGRVKEGGRER